MSKLQNTTTAANVSKVSANTPVPFSFESYVSKMVDPKKAAALKVAHKAAQAKAKKVSVFSLVAGTICKIEHRGMAKAVAYHVAKGNLIRTNDGVALTKQGADLWTAERISGAPDKFQDIANFVKGNRPVPAEWSRQPLTQVASNVRFPNMLYWGSFSTGMMRMAFAALWAK